MRKKDTAGKREKDLHQSTGVQKKLTQQAGQKRSSIPYMQEMCVGTEYNFQMILPPPLLRSLLIRRPYSGIPIIIIVIVNYSVPVGIFP